MSAKYKPSNPSTSAEACNHGPKRGPSIKKRFRIALPLLFLLSLQAGAESETSIFGRVGAVIESITQGLRNVGERSEDLISLRGGAVGDVDVLNFPNGPVVSREMEHYFSLEREGSVEIENEFGHVEIETWEKREVQLNVDVFTAADEVEEAMEVIRAIEIDINAEPDNVSFRTVLPSRSEVNSEVAMKVNYRVKIPKDAALVCENTVGDTTITGVGGALTLNSRHGAVTLRDIAGETNVRAQGEFPVEVQGFEGSGTFHLKRSQAVFEGVEGVLRVTNFLGPVTLRDVASNADVDVKSENGPIHLYLSGESLPDLMASVTYGEVHSDISLERVSRGNHLVARNPETKTAQRLVLDASFDDIHIHREGAGDALTTAPGNPHSAKAAQERVAPVNTESEVFVDAIRGDVHVKGADVDEVTVSAVQELRMRDPERQDEAREALALRVEADETEGRIMIQTKANEDMDALGCESYRVDLVITMPRTLLLRLYAENGQTVVEELDESVEVKQEIGGIQVDQVSGELDLSTGLGGVSVTNSPGPVKVVASGGEVITRDVQGRQDLTTYNGDTIIDSPREELTIRHENGDVRIVALEGIFGDMNVTVNGGNLSLVRSADANATFLVTVENGVMESAAPMHGSINNNNWEFSGRLNEGQYTVQLTARNGDVLID